MSSGVRALDDRCSSCRLIRDHTTEDLAEMAFNITTLASALLSLIPGGAREYANLPIVDLGFERHQAIEFNTTGQYYNFSNIRYVYASIRVNEAPLCYGGL